MTRREKLALDAAFCSRIALKIAGFAPEGWEVQVRLGPPAVSRSTRDPRRFRNGGGRPKPTRILTVQFPREWGEEFIWGDGDG